MLLKLINVHAILVRPGKFQMFKQTSKSKHTLDANVTSVGFSRRPVVSNQLINRFDLFTFLFLEPTARLMAHYRPSADGFFSKPVMEVALWPGSLWAGWRRDAQSPAHHQASRATSAQRSLWQGLRKRRDSRRYWKCPGTELVQSGVEIESSHPKPPVCA